MRIARTLDRRSVVILDAEAREPIGAGIGGLDRRSDKSAIKTGEP
jgi:hypothetical protein